MAVKAFSKQSVYGEEKGRVPNYNILGRTDKRDIDDAGFGPPELDENVRGVRNR